EEWYLEIHILRGAVLVRCTIYFQPEFQIVNIRYFIGRNEPRPHRRKRITAFSLYPLTTAFKLKSTFTVIVVQAIAGNVLHGIFLFNITSLTSNDDGEFDFPVGFNTIAWDNKIIVRAAERACCLKKYDRLCRKLCTGFFSVIRIIKTYTNNF